jgi:hypothetical protein
MNATRRGAARAHVQFCCILMNDSKTTGRPAALDPIMCRQVQHPHLGPNDASKVKVQFTLAQVTRAQRGSRGIALLFLYPRRYMGVDGQCHAPAALPPGEDPVSVVQEAGWVPGPV